MHFALNSGGVNWNAPGVTGAGAFTNIMTLPADVQALRAAKRGRPSVAKYRGRVYVAGYFNKNLLLTKDVLAHAVGIQPPPNAPTLAAGAGTNGSTGDAIGRIAFRHRYQTGAGMSTIIHESSMSAASATLRLTGTGRLWTNIPATSVDVRVTHVAGYVSVDGAAFFEAWERQLGVTSVEENVLTAALGANGSVRRGVPPWAKYLEQYHDRMWYAGDPEFPYRLWYSELGEPESVAATNFVDTREGETVTGIKKLGDQLLVFCKACTYDVQGYTGTDFNMRKIEPSIGCIAHHTIVNIHERLWFASEAGVYLYSGGQFKPLMLDIADLWRDSYRLSPTTYQGAIAEDDPYWQTYKLLVTDLNNPDTPVYYVGSYKDFDPREGEGAAQPDWTFDTRARFDTTIGRLAGIGEARGDLFTGSSDGIVRKENVDSNFDDDADSGAMTWSLQSKADYFEDLGGGIGHGKVFNIIEIYARIEDNAWTLNLYGGEEGAETAFSPQWTATVPASASGGFLAKNNHFFRPTGAVGQALTLSLFVTEPQGVVFKGHGGAWLEGPQSRPAG